MTCFRLSISVLMLALALGSAAVHADESAASRADEQLNEGQRLFRDHKYPEAIEELRAGYVMSPQPRFLYALGQAYRLNHQCKEAVRAYRDFIRSEPSRTQITATEANITRCGDEDPSSLKEDPVKGPDTSNPQPSGVVIAPATNVITASPSPPHKPTYKKWWPWTILAVAVVGAGLGVGLGLGLQQHGSSFNTTLPPIGPNAH